MLTVRNRGGRVLISKSQPGGPLWKGSCPLVERDLAGFCKAPEALAGVVPEGHADAPRKQCLNVNGGLPFQEEWKRSIPVWERERNRGGVEKRLGREGGREQVSAEERS